MKPSRSKATPIFIFIFILFLVPASLWAAPSDGKGKPGKEQHGKHQGTGDGVEWSLDVSIGITFEDARKLAIEHGLTGRKPLPPGIRKNLALGKPMPPGITRTRMPDAFLASLPHHEGYAWRWSGTDLLLVAVGTLVIAHILEDVFE